MSTDTVAVILIFGGVWVVAIVGIIANTITRSRSKISQREAEEIGERFEALESQVQTLNQAVIGSPTMTSKDALEIAEEAARLEQAQAQPQRGIVGER